MSDVHSVRTRSAFLTTAVAAALFCLATAQAQQQEGRLEEVVVTARKQTENLQSVPLAVSVFSAESIESSSQFIATAINDYSRRFTTN